MQTLNSIGEEWSISEDESVYLNELICPSNPTSGTNPEIMNSGVRVVWDLETGANWQRDGFSELHNAVMAGLVSDLVVFRYDRLARPDDAETIFDFMKFLGHTLPINGVRRWVEGREDQNTGNEFADLFMSLFQAYKSGEERKAILARTAPARVKHFARTGLQGGRQHYLHVKQSYRVRELMQFEGLSEEQAMTQAVNEGMTDPKAVYIHPGHVAIVQKYVIPRIEEGLSAYAIANDLNSLNIPSPFAPYRPNSTWNYDTIHALFSGPSYGHFTRHTKNELVGDEVLTFDNPDLAVFTKEEAHYYRDLLARAKGVRGPKKSRARMWLFRGGNLKCGNCGSSMKKKQRSPDKYTTERKYYYGCRECKGHHFKAEHLEASFIHQLRLDILGEKAKVIEEWERAEIEARKEDSPLRKKIEDYTSQLVNAERELNTLTVSLGKLDAEGPAYESVMNRLVQTEEKIAEIQALRESAKAKLTSLPTEIDRERMSVWIRTLKSIDKMDPEARQRFVGEVIENACYISEPYMNEEGKEIRLGKGWVPPNERPTVIIGTSGADGKATTTAGIGFGFPIKRTENGIDMVPEPGHWSIVYRVPIKMEESVAQFVKSH